MIVTRSQVDNILDLVSKEEFISLDTETTGLMLWKGDVLFSIILGTESESYYFNFFAEEAHDGSKPPEEFILPREETLSKFRVLLGSMHKTCIFMHNAKFDLCALDKEGIKVNAIIHDTEVGSRLERNDHLSYGLSECVSRIGYEKSEAVEDYIKTHKLWEWKATPGKKSRTKNKFFHRVPFGIISAYGLKDAEITYKLGLYQLNAIKEFDEINSINKPSLYGTLLMERDVTPVAFQMEKSGIKIDVDYCKKAIAFEDARAKKIIEQFKADTGFDFKDSPKHLAQVFSSLGFEVPQTEKGSPSFTDDILEEFDNPIANLVREYRDATKRANTYFRSFLFYAEDGIIHANLKQAGTATGRFSCTTPNMQNISKDEDAELPFPIRQAFVPRPDYIFVMIDYNQMEFRLMLDYAGELELIEQIINGHDPHQATAELVNIPRKPAKTLNFGLLYGMGIKKLAGQLGVSVDEAARFKYKYFDALPKVQMFLRKTSKRAEKASLVRDWLGRAFHFPDPEFAYKAANAIIQGGCASVVKIAMVRLGKLLEGKKSRMLLQVHDELIFEVHKDELHLVEKLQEIMETVYPYRHIPLTCSVSHSLKSWGEPVEGFPENAKRDQVQNQSQRRSERIVGDGLCDLVH